MERVEKPFVGWLQRGGSSVTCEVFYGQKKTLFNCFCLYFIGYQEELFGPVAALIEVADEKEAIRTANDTVFGLGAAVFTRDVKKGESIAAQELLAGCCCVNDSVKSDPRLPFGGIKQSGYGRELGMFGIYEFVNIKTVWVS